VGFGHGDECVPLPTGIWGGDCVPSSDFFWNFYIKMVSCAFWVAISYRLAACFARIGIRTCGIEIYWRSLQHLGIQFTPSGKLREKMTMCQKLPKKCAKIALFFLYIFRIYSRKIFQSGELGA